MKYAIVGTGAIGGFYGGLLAKAGRDVHFLFHSDFEYVRENGLQINSCDGSYHLDNVNAYNDTAVMPQCDVVLVGLKSTANGQLADMLKPLLKDNTIVVLIQNGIGLEEDLQAQLPTAQIAAGCAYICTIKNGPGLIDHLSNGRLTIGSFSCRDRDALSAVVADMADAGIRVKTADYWETRWKKCVWNMPFNGLTALLGTDSGSLLRNEATNRLVLEMMSEVVKAAKACGVSDIDDDYAQRMVDMTLAMPPYSSSMQVDRQRNRPMEIYYIYTRPIEEARKHGFEMARMSMLEALLRYV